MVAKKGLKILIISEYFAPANSVASIRWTKIAKYLNKKNNCCIDLLTNEKDFEGNRPYLVPYKFSEALEGDLQYIHRVYYLRSNFFSKCVCLIWSLARLFKKVLDRYSPKKSGSTQIKSNSRNQLSLGDSLARNVVDLWSSSMGKSSFPKDFNFESYDAVISSYGPKWSHYLARKIKEEYPEIIWIADYRDPVVSEARGNHEEDKQFVATVTGTSDCVLTVSFGEDAGKDLYLDPRQKLEVVPNGFDPEEMALDRSCNSEKFIVSYTGALWDFGTVKQTLIPIFKVLSEMIENDPSLSSKIIFKYVGNTPDLFWQEATEFPLVSAENAGYVSREEALKIQRESALLAFATWNTSLGRGVVTGKIYEYLMSGVPVVGVCSGDLPNSLSKEMIEKAEVGVCFEEVSAKADYERLASFIWKKYCEWTTKGFTTTLANEDYIMSFSYDKRADQVFELINGLKK